MAPPTLADKRAWLEDVCHFSIVPDQTGFHLFDIGQTPSPYRLMRPTVEQLIEDAYADLCAEDRL